MTLAVFVGACRGAALSPPPRPLPTADAPAPVAVTTRVELPAHIPGTTWRVQSVARMTVRGAGVSGAAAEEQRVTSAALVSWSLDRQPSGALRATGQVDSFVVRTSFDAQRGVSLPATPAIVLLEATLDSAVMRVVTRPPLANECDRPEAGAAALARDLLVRVPDGVSVGSRWKDSSVTLICRSGVPMTVYSTVKSRLEELTGDRLVIRRETVGRLEGKGGSAFRVLELVGTSSGSQRVEIAAQRGTVERLEGSGTLTLTAVERLPGNPPRTQQIIQRTELTAVRR